MQYALSCVGIGENKLSKIDAGKARELIDRWVKSTATKAEEKEPDGETPTGDAIVAQEKLDAYLEEQMELFGARCHNRYRALTSAMIPTGQVLPNGLAMMRIVDRKVTFVPADPDENYEGLFKVSYQDRIISHDLNRGKYNDGHLLIEQSTASVDRSEMM